MTREQVVKLGYFTSMQRANARLLLMRNAGLLHLVRLNPSLDTRQHLYSVARSATDFLDSKIASLLTARSVTPRHVDHALATVNMRIELMRLGMTRWLPEPQIRHRYSRNAGVSTRIEEFRPDGLAKFGSDCVFVEIDRGHVSSPRMKVKLGTYRAYVRHGPFKATYEQDQATLLIVTTGRIRKRHIERHLSAASPVAVAVETFESLSRISSLAEVRFQ